MMRNFYILLLLCSSACGVAQKPIAFPGAEGFGKYTTGGRGGKVVIVENLNDDGPGSLRDAIQKKGPRIIVFAVSGNIELKSPLDINNGDVTIAGQSAPGDGICLKNYGTSVKADNVIIRFLRFRLGDQQQQQTDAISGNKGMSNIIIDHCSMSWSTDECASFYRNKNFTMQWCIISESLNASVHEKGSHGYGGIWGGVGASFHHNLLASHTSRLPRFSGSSSTKNSEDELVDFRNNVVYNWKSNSTYGGERGRYNMVANFYKPGPATPKSKFRFVDPSEPYGRFHLDKNVFSGDQSLTENNQLGMTTEPVDSVYVTRAFNTEPIREHEAEEAFQIVLKYAGASHRRDAVDARVVEEVRSGESRAGRESNGIIDSQNDVGGWPVLKTEKPAVDSDHDGLPDEWEKKHGLDPKNPADATAQTIQSGYDNIEVYLNSLVEKFMVL